MLTMEEEFEKFLGEHGPDFSGYDTIDILRAGFEAGFKANGGMRGVLRDVAEFHRATDCPVMRQPVWPEDRIDLRVELITEEMEKELFPAIEERNMEGTADGIADSVYVLAGTMLEFGYPAEVWDEVQQANMRKVDPETGKVRRREDGKILKPEGWTPPDIKGVLEESRK